MRYFLTLIGLIATTAMLSASNLYDFEIQTINGQPLNMQAYQGKVVLVVNVASKCGHTKQYAGLQALYDEFKDRGLVILGVPSNDFGKQEPGSDAEILAFCTDKFSVNFPLTTKVPVKGEEAHPLYQWLGGAKGEPKWNFHKYLIGKDGAIIEAYPSKVQPDSADLRAAVEQALK